MNYIKLNAKTLNNRGKTNEDNKIHKYQFQNKYENEKIYGEITDIDLKRRLEGIKEIIIIVIYNDKSEKLHLYMLLFFLRFQFLVLLFELYILHKN